MTLGRSADEQRLVHLYYYLCTCLAIQQKAGGGPYLAAIAERLGDRDLRRILSPLLQEDLSWREKARELGKLNRTTTGTLVEMLKSLNDNLQTAYRQHEESYIRVLAPEDILTALYKLIDLTSEERQALNLPSGDELTLLQRALLILQTTGGLENHEMIFQVYKAAVDVSFADTSPPLESLEAVDGLVAQVVQKALSYLPDRPNKRVNSKYLDGKEKTVTTLTRKAQREVRRLLARSGNQLSSMTQSSMALNSYVRQYLQPAFVTKLAQTVVANERLTDQFPVYLKRITIRPSGPLPFADSELDVLKQADGPYPPLLHPALRQLEQMTVSYQTAELPGPGDYELASQEATEVIVEFYVKVPENYVPAVAPIFEQIASGNRRRIDFSLRSTGIGGALSHVIKVINFALLSDIPCLQAYFPIGHDIISTQKIIQDDVSSPVWAHSLVKLCRKETLGKTLQSHTSTQLGSYETLAFADPMGHGDYCGFDFLLSQVQSALHARLQAIRNAGVNPDLYIQHLCQRTERFLALRNAWDCLRGYPFSTLAMIGLIEKRILSELSGSPPLQKADSYIYFDACLSITEALLDEGAYRPARQYLKRLEVLDSLVEQGLNANQPKAEEFEIFSGGLIIRYLLCLANYYYLYDIEDRSQEYLPPGCQADLNREGLVRRAWGKLDQAQLHARIRLRKYVAVNEVSQSTFSPHYLLLGRIAFLKAKLMLFFPKWVPLQGQNPLPTDNQSSPGRAEACIHWGRLWLMEKARLYAAAEGNSEIYACYAAMQCWTYLIAACAQPTHLNLRSVLGNEKSPAYLGPLAVSDCLEWAKRLRDHALISYATIGRKYYYQIKEKSGLPKETLDDFGFYEIEKIPAIYEIRESAERPLGQNASNLLVLDMSLLGINPSDLPKLSPNHPEHKIYLFGSIACYLFFARGLFLLCSNVTDEFEALDSNTPIHWPTKLLQATRLFNMAWAIAEEGCELNTGMRDQERYLHIIRSFQPEATDDYAPPEVCSTRDLYPRQINEIADLGKIFAAACLVLRMPLVAASERPSLAHNINHVLNHLHGSRTLRQSPSFRALIKRQRRYNGHLDIFLQRAKDLILQQAQTINEDVPIETQRNQLIRALFSFLQEG